MAARFLATRLAVPAAAATTAVTAAQCSRYEMQRPMEVKLQYFDIEGAAEKVRLAMILGRVGFDDERVVRDSAATAAAAVPRHYHAPTTALQPLTPRLLRAYDCLATADTSPPPRTTPRTGPR